MLAASGIISPIFLPQLYLLQNRQVGWVGCRPPRPPLHCDYL